MLPLIRKGTVALGVAASLIALPGTAEADTDWAPDLSVIDGDDVNVRHDGHALRLRDTRTGPAALDGAVASGRLLLAPTDLPEPVNRVSAQVTGDGTVEVRAHLGGTEWTEWYPAGEVLPAASRRIQVRVVLSTAPGGASPAVSSVRLTGEQVAQPRVAAAAARTYRIYATREGLVGGTTASGHVITARDHFVALPSRRGLSSNNAGEYSVRVCTTSGSRCEYAPVWDVGPWNTRDDYWNPPSVRQMWTDLAQGRPEAQAAYQDGYNGGKDEFGRTVANPAGIDLADGTFWDGLRLTDNAWVNVTYLWTGSGPKGIVRTAGAPLNVRSSASTSAGIVGLAANYANVIVECHVRGQTVTGTYGTSDLWNRIGPGHFVPDVYLYTGSDDPVAPAC
ncbi:hypothetical protein Acsp04_16530 [Actinomadura sp. NBRC 104425]|uniref:hypothetical protein n=1 Tax=Actinomadura sp. NBRC 104425 TaxID=3032204 RepID=UPI00249FD091|nr:hypothetical protein [Actinomadura sp. NBRC 104425]GLZ11418.1 hypothetical protein Acsp04_16530 [Actinomadura sp. NBRC 104425]